jgi:hypothetical protein
MYSITGDTFRNGRRVRAATLEYALDQFPRLIYKLKTNKLQVSVTKRLCGCVVFLRDPVGKDQWSLIESDFVKCRDIAGQVITSLFPNDNYESVLLRIRSLVRFAYE